MPKKALIVVPSFAGVQARPFRNFLELACVAGRMCPDWRFGFLAPERQSLVKAMTDAGSLVLQQDFDCLITFDDDCFPPYDCVPRLLAHREAGRSFVAGVGVMRSYPHTTTVGKEFAEGLTLLQRPAGPTSAVGYEWLDDLDTDTNLRPVDFCGLPVALIGREVFDQLPMPWFSLVAADGGTVTHDIFLCRQMKAVGIPVLVDPTLKCGHLAEAPVITFENRALARELVG